MRLPDSKQCASCKRVLKAGKFKYLQTSPDHLDRKCTTCRCWKGGGNPSLSQVEMGEKWLLQMVSKAKEKYDPIEDRILFEELLYKLMLAEGYLEHWKPPVWLNTTIFQND